MVSVLSNPRYRGKHVMVIKNKVYTARSGKVANRILDKLEKRFPREVPALTYIPKEDTLILCL